jgi:hypothetical protein
MGAWQHEGYEKCTQIFKEEPMEERLLKRHRHQATNSDRGVLYFTKFLIVWIILFPCFMKEICKWSTRGMILTEKWRTIMRKTVPSHFVNHKSYGDWPGIKPVPARWEFGDQVPEPWHDFRLWMGRQRLVRFASQTQNLFAGHSSTRQTSPAQAFLLLGTSPLPIA